MILHPVAVVPTILAVFFAGCASEDPESATPGAPAASSPTESGKSPRSRPAREGESRNSPTIDITIEDGEFSPQAQRIEAQVGVPVTLDIESDVAGEFHVHSDPEQEIVFGPGKSTHQITVEQPGIVEVESHDLGAVILQLEVH